MIHIVSSEPRNVLISHEGRHVFFGLVEFIFKIYSVTALTKIHEALLQKKHIENCVRLMKNYMGISSSVIYTFSSLFLRDSILLPSNSLMNT